MRAVRVLDGRKTVAGDSPLKLLGNHLQRSCPGVTEKHDGRLVSRIAMETMLGVSTLESLGKFASDSSQQLLANKRR